MKKLTIIILAVIVFMFSACSNEEKTTSEKIFTEGMQLLDPYTQTEKYVGIMDNLFIAEVIKKEKTFMYEKESTFANEKDILAQKFKIKIIENIKGELAIGKEMSLYVQSDGIHDERYEYDFSSISYLNPGATYLLTASVMTEADFMVGETDVQNTLEPEAIGGLISRLGFELPNNYKSSEIYAKWMKAYENELPREKWKSVEGKD